MEWNSTTWSEVARWITEAEGGRLSERERDFVAAMMTRDGEPLPCQLAWLSIPVLPARGRAVTDAEKDFRDTDASGGQGVRQKRSDPQGGRKRTRRPPKPNGAAAAQAVADAAQDADGGPAAPPLTKEAFRTHIMAIAAMDEIDRPPEIAALAAAAKALGYTKSDVSKHVAALVKARKAAEQAAPEQAAVEGDAEPDDEDAGPETDWSKVTPGEEVRAAFWRLIVAAFEKANSVRADARIIAHADYHAVVAAHPKIGKWFGKRAFTALFRQATDQLDAARKEKQRADAETKAQARGAQILPAGDYIAIAEAYLSTHHNHPEGRILAWWSGAFYRWTGPRWEEILPGETEDAVYRWLDGQLLDTGEQIIECRPDTRLRNEVVAAIVAITRREGIGTGWTGKAVCARPVSVENGILDLATGKLHLHTPRLFNLASIASPWLPDAPPVFETPFGDWLIGATIKEGCIFLDERDNQIVLLQEIFGYIISGDTRAQKIFLVTGPKRSGKGTLGNILTRLLDGQVASLTARKLETTFGLQVCIGKLLAIFPDMRIDPKDRHIELTERLLSISGEDPQSIGRKFRIDWNGILGVRLLILSNAVPRLHDDAGGVLASRFIHLHFPNSYFYREDQLLLEKLWEHRASILNWAVAGAQRLARQNGVFSLTAMHRRQMRKATLRMDPVTTFIASCLEVTGNPRDRVRMDFLWAAMNRIMRENSMERFTRKGFARIFWHKDIDGVSSGRGPIETTRAHGRRAADNRIYSVVAIVQNCRYATGVRWTDAKLNERVPLPPKGEYPPDSEAAGPVMLHQWLDQAQIEEQEAKSDGVDDTQDT